MAVIPGVLLLIVVLELVERLKVFQAQRAQKALLHFTCSLEGGWITGGHDSGQLRCRRRDARWEILASVHISRGVKPTPYQLHHATEKPGTLKSRVKQSEAAHI